MATNEDGLVLGAARRRARIRLALLVGVLAVAATALFPTGHHRVAHPTAAARVGVGAAVCGQDLLRPPQSGAGPIDGGLLVTQARIPPVLHPSLEPVSAARRWLAGDAPVVVVHVGGQARAYPFAILQWHEVIDDSVRGMPIAVTYCPLCNTAIVYSRVVAGRTVQLESSGALLLGSAVLDDPVTRELWSQVSGKPTPNYGRIASAPLTWLPSDTLSLDGAAAAYPGLVVLARPRGTGIDYARSPYGRVAASYSLPDLFVGWVDEHLAPKARLVGVVANRAAAAWRYDALRRVRVRNDTVGGKPVVVIFRPHVTGIGDSADLHHAPLTGAAAVFDARVGGRVLHFTHIAGDMLLDRETRSDWDLSGHAVNGPLRGTRLAPLHFVDTYWFAWIAFHPHTRVWPAVRSTECAGRRR